ncbi:hypothetical protein Hypma_012378, partial [Hypsizygus marmoreus]
FRDTYFVHELRGTKGATVHNPYSRDERKEALTKYLEFVDVDKLDPEQWWIDVGIEIHLAGHIVQWLESSHKDLLKFALPSKSDRDIVKLHEGKHFFLDRVAQLKDLAGFRLDPLTRGRDDGVQYVNVYTTDKAVTYQLHTGLWRRRNASDLLPAKIGRLAEDLNKMSGILREVSKSPHMDGNARFEVRINLAQARRQHTYLPEALIRRSVVAFPSRNWWLFKFYRLSAFFAVVTDLSTSEEQHRRWHASLTLGAMVVYMMNALNYREGQSADEQELLIACSQHVWEVDWDEDPDDVEEHPLAHARGLWFVSSVNMADKAARLHPRRLPRKETVARLYGEATFDQLAHRFGHTAILIDKPVGGSNVRRISNRRVDPRPAQWAPEDLSDDERDDIDIEGRGITLRALDQMAGEDLDDWGGAPEDQDGDYTPNAILALILKHFPHDVFSCSANRKDRRKTAYVLLSYEDIAEVTIHKFKTLDLSDIFTRVQARLCNAETWDMLFDRYFPPRGTPPIVKGEKQNFPYTYYYPRWIDLMNRVETERAAKLIRDEVRKKFNALHWVPFAGSDRMWTTGTSSSKLYVLLPADGHRGSCPWIAVNARHGKLEDVRLCREEDPDPVERPRKRIRLDRNPPNVDDPDLPEEEEEENEREEVAGLQENAANFYLMLREEEEEGSDEE